MRESDETDPCRRLRRAACQEEGALGCFLLTEKQAGVLSGLIVETTADWDPASQVGGNGCA